MNFPTFRGRKIEKAVFLGCHCARCAPAGVTLYQGRSCAGNSHRRGNVFVIGEVYPTSYAEPIREVNLFGIGWVYAEDVSFIEPDPTEEMQPDPFFAKKP